mgnify:FL=1
MCHRQPQSIGELRGTNGALRTALSRRIFRDRCQLKWTNARSSAIVGRKSHSYAARNSASRLEMIRVRIITIVAVIAMGLATVGMGWSGGPMLPECGLVVAPGPPCRPPVAPLPLCQPLAVPEKLCAGPVAPISGPCRLAVPARLCAAPIAPTCLPNVVVPPARLCATPVAPFPICTRYVIDWKCASPAK